MKVIEYKERGKKVFENERMEVYLYKGSYALINKVNQHAYIINEKSLFDFLYIVYLEGRQV